MDTIRRATTSGWIWFKTWIQRRARACCPFPWRLFWKPRSLLKIRCVMTVTHSLLQTRLIKVFWVNWGFGASYQFFRWCKWRGWDNMVWIRVWVRVWTRRCIRVCLGQLLPASALTRPPVASRTCCWPPRLLTRVPPSHVPPLGNLCIFIFYFVGHSSTL